MFAGRNGHDNYIIMKEDMKMEDQILMLYYSVFPFVSGSVNHFTGPKFRICH